MRAKRWYRRWWLWPLLLLVVFFVWSMWMRATWGKDSDSIEMKGYFKAHRDSNGVWDVEAQSLESLWFATGYLQTWDREFQLEFIRRSALGRLSEWFGEKVLSRDRLMRAHKIVSEQEWKTIPENSLERKAILAFIKGHEAYLEHPYTAEPIEYKVFGIQRSDIGAWNPSDILAMIRMHSWELSMDLRYERRRIAMKHYLGAELAKLLNPLAQDWGEPLYSKKTFEGLHKASVSRRKNPEIFWPELAQNQIIKRPGEQIAGAHSSELDRIWESFGEGTQWGASNAWIFYDPKMGIGPTLCNDTHLRFLWPSALYPMKYKILANNEKDVASHAQGFWMPGIPPMVLGTIEEKDGSRLAWGITIAMMADSQDLVKLPKKYPSKTRSETFLIKNPENGEVQTKVFSQEWTPWGPRIDSYYNNFDIPYKDAIALHWTGWKTRLKSPLGFFLNLQVAGASNFVEDLKNSWDYPHVNLLWMAKNSRGEEKAGHLLTGVLISRRRDKTLDWVENSELGKWSFPDERPYVESTLNQSKSWILVSANQKVYEGALSNQLASDWMYPYRAERIEFLLKQRTFKSFESIQQDTHSEFLSSFYKKARIRVDVNRLCAQGKVEFVNSCRQILTSLDAWDFQMLKEHWEPSVVALWVAHFERKLWPESFKLAGPLHDLFVEWHSSNTAMRVVQQILDRSEYEKNIMSFLHVNLEDLLVSSFVETLTDLEKEKGPLSAMWQWGEVHTLEWMHPFKFIPVIGEWLLSSMVGPAPGWDGYFDSVKQASPRWDFVKPNELPAEHGPAMRMCVDFQSKKTEVNWSNLTGVSGNPMSKYSHFSQ